MKHINYLYYTSYGLLGSSGCGKTTLLRCILGRLNLESGSIKVLGKAPGTTGHQVPGRDVGYMPQVLTHNNPALDNYCNFSLSTLCLIWQELALYGEFTTKETMYYFGILNRMSRKYIQERMRFLLELLELPQSNRLIRKLRY